MRKGLAAAGVVALITAGSAACGADKTTPQGKVSNAFEKLGQQKTVTLGLGFDGSADQIYAAMKDENDFTRDDAKMLSSLHMSLAVSSQKSFSLLGKSAADKEGSFALALSDEGTSAPLTEIRYVDKKAYLRVDIKGLEKLDTDSSDSKDLDEFNQFVDGADQLPSSLASVKAALKGQWVSIDPKSFVEFAKSMGGSGTGSGDDSASPFGAGLPTLDPQTQQQVLTDLRKALSTDVTYTELGSKNGADHIKATVPAQQFVKDVATDVEPALKKIPGFKQSDLDDMKNAKGVPNKNISVDLAIKNGSITAVTFDVAQLDTQAKGALPLTLTLDGSAKAVSAPSGAVQLNPQDIMGMFMANMPKGAGDDSSF